MDKEIDSSDWDDYLAELFEWISGRFNKVNSGVISEAKYKQELIYYESEVKRVEKMIKSQSQSTGEDNPEEPNFVISPELIHDYFFNKKQEFNKLTDTARLMHKNPAAEESTIFNIPTPQKFVPEGYSTFGVEVNSESKVEEEKEEIIQFPIQKKDTKSKKLIIGSKDNPAKVVFLGEPGVGRTNLKRALLEKNFVEDYITTVGANIEDIEYEGYNFHIFGQLVDISSKDFYIPLRTSFLSQSSLGVIVFDLSENSTFLRIEYWLKELLKNKGMGIDFIIVGTKSDLKQKVSEASIQRLISGLESQLKFSDSEFAFLKVSSKTGENIPLLKEAIRQTLMNSTYA